MFITSVFSKNRASLKRTTPQNDPFSNSLSVDYFLRLFVNIRLNFYDASSSITNFATRTTDEK